MEDELLEIAEIADEAAEEEIMEEAGMTEDEIMMQAKDDFEAMKKDKKNIDGKIQTWRKLYNGDPLGSETEGRSKYVAKEAQKAINWWIPNALKPFMSSNDIAEFIPRTADDIEKAKSQNTLINFQMNNDFPKYQFLHSSLQLYSSEGTVVARTGWDHEEGEPTVEPFEGLTQEEVVGLEQAGATIEILDQAEVEHDPTEGAGTYMIFKGVATKKNMIKSRPTAEVIRVEDFFILGENIHDCTATVQRIDTTMSDLREEGIYQNLEELQATLEDRDSSLGQERETQLEDYGNNEGEKSAKGRDDITIYEYYGNMDVNKDGTNTPVVFVWSGNIAIRNEGNPFPDNEPPYISAPFMTIPFSFYGNGLPHFLKDVTHLKSAITRTAIDLMATSTNGTKHIQKGSIDARNARKLKEAKIGSVIEWNDIGGYQAELKSDIPSSLMPLLEYFTAEGENESGITRYNQGLDAKSLNKTATGITAIMGQSQMRTWETVTRFAEQFMKPLFRKWIAYNQAFLDTEVAVRVVGDQYTAISPDDIKGNFDITVNVGVAGSEEAKSQKIIGLLQMITPLVEKGVLPPDHVTRLVAELEELSGFKDLSSELKQVAEQKKQAATQTQQMFLSLPPEAQEQIMQVAQQMQQQQGNPQQGQQPQ